MSRYTFTGKEARLKIVVGWDVPLQTFFVQVWDEPAEGLVEGGGLLLWAGTAHGEVPTVEGLTALLWPYGHIPEDVLGALRRDRAESDPPTPLQLYLTKLTS